MKELGFARPRDVDSIVAVFGMKAERRTGASGLAKLSPLRRTLTIFTRAEIARVTPNKDTGPETPQDGDGVLSELSVRRDALEVGGSEEGWGSGKTGEPLSSVIRERHLRRSSRSRLWLFRYKIGEAAVRAKDEGLCVLAQDRLETFSTRQRQRRHYSPAVLLLLFGGPQAGRCRNNRHEK